METAHVSRSLVLITMVRDQGIEIMKENTGKQIVTIKEPRPQGYHKHRLAGQGNLQVNKVCNLFLRIHMLLYWGLTFCRVQVSQDDPATFD